MPGNAVVKLFLFIVISAHVSSLMAQGYGGRGGGGGGSGGTLTLSRNKYFSFNLGYSQFRYDPMKEVNVLPAGFNYGVSLATKLRFLGAEVFVRTGRLNADFIHDGESNKFIHSQLTYGGSLNIFFNPRVYLKAGCFFTNINQTIKESVPEHTETAIKSTYVVMEEKKLSGMFYGLGYNFYVRNAFGLYVSANYFILSKEAYELFFEMGVKLYFQNFLAL